MKRHLKLRRNYISEIGTKRSITKAVNVAYQVINDIFESADTPLEWEEFYEYVVEELSKQV